MLMVIGQLIGQFLSESIIYDAIDVSMYYVCYYIWNDIYESIIDNYHIKQANTYE